MSKKLHFLDLFAGAGGLSEGFIQAGFSPIAHIEVDKAACFTLRTRMAYHWLKSNNKEDVYVNYLKGLISRNDLYKAVPERVIDSIINKEISEETIGELFSDIDNLLGDNNLDVVIGGPPCQAYSLVGRACDTNKMLGDKRNYLYIFYANFLKYYKPKFFIFENVTGLLSAKDKNGKLYLDTMCQLFKEIGYSTEYRVLDASDYGVLQARKRIILIGCRDAELNFYPILDIWKPEVSVNEIFSDLPPLQAGEGNIRVCKMGKYHGKWLRQTGIRNDHFPVTWHVARPNNDRDLEIYRRAVELWMSDKKRLEYDDLPDNLKTHKNRTAFVDRFKVVAAELPFAHTVLAHLSKDGHYYIHPDIKQNQSITPREAARLQTFPDDYYFEGVTEKPSRAAAFKQIGNAVPVLLARRVAEKLKEKWV